jgi:hypothetical protein
MTIDAGPARHSLRRAARQHRPYFGDAVDVVLWALKFSALSDLIVKYMSDLISPFLLLAGCVYR